MIPANATQAGTMTGSMQNTPGSHIQAIFENVLQKWQAAVNEEHYVTEGYTHPSDQVHGTFGAKYARLDIGGSGAFMVDIDSGLIYGIKGYGKVDKKKVSGNIYDPGFAAAVLVRDRFRHGRFENNPNGSPKVGFGRTR